MKANENKARFNVTGSAPNSEQSTATQAREVVRKWQGCAPARHCQLVAKSVSSLDELEFDVIVPASDPESISILADDLAHAGLKFEKFPFEWSAKAA